MDSSFLTFSPKALSRKKFSSNIVQGSPRSRFLKTKIHQLQDVQLSPSNVYNIKKNQRKSVGSKNKSSNTIVLDDSVEVISVSDKNAGKSVSSCVPKPDSSKESCSAEYSTLTFKHVKDNEPESSDNDKFEEIRNWLFELHTAHERKRLSPPWSSVNKSSVLEVSPISRTPELATISSSKWRIPETSSDESMESWKQKIEPHPVSNLQIRKSGKAPSTGCISESSDEIVKNVRRNKICFVISDSDSTDARSDQLPSVANKNTDFISDSSSKESKLSLPVSKKGVNSKFSEMSTKSTCSNDSVISECSADRILSTLYGNDWDKDNVLTPVVRKKKTIMKKPAPEDGPTSIVSTLSEFYGSSWNKNKVLTPFLNRRKITKGKENTPPVVGKVYETPFETPKSKVSISSKSTPKSCSLRRGVSKIPQEMLSFLQSLSACSPRRCDPEALLYKREFKKNKGELCTHLFKLYNAEVFENKLPFNLRIDWNARMVKTAGFCYYQTVLGSKGKIRTSRIELSAKVCTTADRVRDTLIHELCHAAVWIFSGCKAGHGAEWKAWTRKATKRFPELPGIERCHRYNIEKKYMYKCKSCGYSFGRHSKSLDLQRKRCGYCYGAFELLVNVKPRNADAGVQSTRTVRAASGFALYVKENYKTTKEKNSGLKHAEIMKLLGSQFAGMKVKPNQ